MHTCARSLLYMVLYVQITAADTIYGVTMQERGVTKLISMRFKEGKIEEDEKTEA